LHEWPYWLELLSARVVSQSGTSVFSDELIREFNPTGHTTHPISENVFWAFLAEFLRSRSLPPQQMPTSSTVVCLRDLNFVRVGEARPLQALVVHHPPLQPTDVSAATRLATGHQHQALPRASSRQPSASATNAPRSLPPLLACILDSRNDGEDERIARRRNNVTMDRFMDVVFLVCLTSRIGYVCCPHLKQGLAIPCCQLQFSSDILVRHFQRFLNSQGSRLLLSPLNVHPSQLRGIGFRPDLPACVAIIDLLLQNDRNVERFCAQDWRPFELERPDGAFGLTETTLQQVLRDHVANVSVFSARVGLHVAAPRLFVVDPRVLSTLSLTLACSAPAPSSNRENHHPRAARTCCELLSALVSIRLLFHAWSSSVHFLYTLSNRLLC
jgi:hypothetical protein